VCPYRAICIPSDVRTQNQRRRHGAFHASRVFECAGRDADTTRRQEGPYDKPGLVWWYEKNSKDKDAQTLTAIFICIAQIDFPVRRQDRGSWVALDGGVRQGMRECLPSKAQPYTLKPRIGLVPKVAQRGLNHWS
jgi:hypothetical protein